MSAPVTVGQQVLATDLCPQWCRHPHAGETVTHGDGTNHYAAPIIDDALASVRLSAWVDFLDGKAVREAPTVLVAVPEAFLTPAEVLRLCEALLSATKACVGPDAEVSA